MDIREARKILEVTEQDDDRMIKIKFRRKMRIHHPDAAREDTYEQKRKAQRINEAYQILKMRNKSDMSGYEYQRNQHEWHRQAEQGPEWQGETDESLFTERNIYMTYSLAHSEQYRTVVAKGRFLWDPNLEEFKLLLQSLNHAATELLEQIERKHGIYDNSEIMNISFPYLKDIFDYLAHQVIRPISCLRKIDDPISKDEEGRSIYLFHAFLGTKGSSRVLDAMERLKEGALLYPASMKDNKLTVADAEGVELGHLSLEEDELYYIVIPILQKRQAQVKIEVAETYVNKKHRPYQAKVNVKLYLRIDESAVDKLDRSTNLKIAELLNQYDEELSRRD